MADGVSQKRTRADTGEGGGGGLKMLLFHNHINLFIRISSQFLGDNVGCNIGFTSPKLSESSRRAWTMSRGYTPDLGWIKLRALSASTESE